LGSVYALMVLSVCTTVMTYKRRLWAVASDGRLWVSAAHFWQTPRRSWPWPSAQLERLAAKLGIDAEQLRALLRDAIQQRLREHAVAQNVARLVQLKTPQRERVCPTTHSAGQKGECLDCSSRT
jgi:hypothetical protein